MKSKDVLRLLQISRPTLTKYVKQNIIKTTTLIIYLKNTIQKLLLCLKWVLKN